MKITFAWSKYGEATKLFKLFTSLTISRTWFDPKEFWGSCVSDGAAQKVAVIEYVKARVLMMHNGDKVGASAVGELIWTNMKVDINPFPEEENLISKAHKLETNFFYDYERYKQLWKLVNALSGAHVEWVKLCLYLNGTRISTRQPLL